MGEYNQSSEHCIGSNRLGPHFASEVRPVNLPEWSKPTLSGYSISNNIIGEQWPGSEGKPFKVVMIGGGAAGIDFLHHASTELSGLNIEIKCFEKNPDIGGTWYENRYPGCACDGPSASYQFPWRPNPDWTQFYSGSKEIWSYMKVLSLMKD